MREINMVSLAIQNLLDIGFLSDLRNNIVYLTYYALCRVHILHIDITPSLKAYGNTLFDIILLYACLFQIQEVYLKTSNVRNSKAF